MQHSPIDAIGNADALDPRILRLAHALAELVNASPATSNALDDLVYVGDCGIERAAVMRLVRSGELPGRRLGRKVYVRRSELVALVAKQPTKHIASTSAETSYAAVLRKAKAKVR